MFSILLLTYSLSGSLYIYTVCTSLFCTTKVVPLPWPSYSGSSSCPRVIGINNQVRGVGYAVLARIICRSIRGESRRKARLHIAEQAQQHLLLPDTMAQESAPQPLTLQLVRFEYRHIYSIDQLAQTFSARVFILLKIPADEVEARKKTFPLADNGEDKPPFKSARWYLSMLRIHNMADGGSVETNIVTDAKGGLDCSMIVSGTFHVMFELHEFPLDYQYLGVHLRCLTLTLTNPNQP